MTHELRGWYDSAGVRRLPRRVMDEDRVAGLRVFPEELVPHLGHEAAKALPTPARDALLAQHFYNYMLFTVSLETKVVNRGAALIANDEIDVRTSPATRLDAFKIYCDEGYHALYSLDIVQQAEEMTGIPALPYAFDWRLAQLDRTADRFLPKHPDLARLLQVVAFETVVTTFLSRIPYDESVCRPVRLLVGDHLRDEVHHHAYFSSFFKELWVSLPTSLREKVACAMPHFVADCLRTDRRPIRAALRSAGLDVDDCEDVLRDCYGDAPETAAIRAAGRHTLDLCEGVGCFSFPAAAEQLELLGLGR